MNIVVYCGSSPASDKRFIEAAEELGAWIANSGNRLIYGGSSIGLMGAVSRAVLEAGGEVIGVEPQFFIDAGVAQHDLSELIVVQTMTERKMRMIELGDVFVALPGGVGTLEEIAEILSRIRLGLEVVPCYFLDLDGFYAGLKQQFKAMVKAGFIEDEALGDYCFCDSVKDLTERLAIHSLPQTPKPSTPIVPESNIG